VADSCIYGDEHLVTLKEVYVLISLATTKF
jgi:hypothetical protein